MNWLSWDHIGHLADLLGIVSAVPFLGTAAYFLSRARRLRRHLRQLEGITSARPAALAVSLAGTRIRPAVEDFCAGLGPGMRIYEVQRARGLTPAEVPRLLLELQGLKNRLQDEGVSEVHLFLSCPLAVACAIGALFDNWVPVKVYQFNQGRYEFWTTLHGGYVAGLARQEEEA
ncbi:MAG: hypothetical protein KatS3mg131_2246 [Candidatus Tectimicrobiota bacterium]|nr:MAG: hypothetical protein KatS3mg131_2246 [Candidatus Tectomicrobia bacterium]